MKGYKIDFTMGTITMTKDFCNKAATHGTPEYKILKNLQKDFPYLDCVTRAPRKRKQSDRLTFDNMRCFIRCQNNADILLNEFEQVRALSSGQGGNHYQNVKQWFLETFPNYKETPRFDEKGNMVNDFTRLPEREDSDKREQPAFMQKSA